MLRKIAVPIVLVGLLVVIVVGIVLATAQAGKQTSDTYVLVHGAFQDASGWEEVAADLEAAGQHVVAVELPGRGEDSTPISEITLETYQNAVIDVINQQEVPVILVGHSFGGIVISAVAEAIPDKIDRLVYVAAYLPQNGDSLVSLSSQDHYSVVGQEGNFIPSADFSHGSVNPEVFASAFCPDCSEAQSEAVEESELDEPLAPLNEPITLTEENFGSVAKSYVMTAQDLVVSPQLQTLMLANTPVNQVYALNTGHVPYITAPAELPDVLMRIGKS